MQLKLQGKGVKKRKKGRKKGRKEMPWRQVSEEREIICI